jgi:hypothetical protein
MVEIQPRRSRKSLLSASIASKIRVSFDRRKGQEQEMDVVKAVLYELQPFRAQDVKWFAK